MDDIPSVSRYSRYESTGPRRAATAARSRASCSPSARRRCRLDRIDGWIEDRLLDGPELNAADFQIAPNVTALMLSDDLRAFIDPRPAAALARRVAPHYAGHIPAVLPREWLATLGPAGLAR